MPDPTAFYFGCRNDDAGHHPFDPKMRMVNWHDFKAQMPWPKIDGGLTPTRTIEQGAAELHHRDGWTALGIHDYTTDSRRGSNAVFIFEGTFTFEQVLQLARSLFPTVSERIGEINLATATPTEDKTEENREHE